MRRERQSRGEGRYYLLVVDAVDACGGRSVKVCVAGLVPKSVSYRWLDEVRNAANNAAVLLQQAVDAPGPFVLPAGLYEHGLADPVGMKQ